MINPVLVWFHIAHIYNDETLITTKNLYIIYLNRYSGCKYCILLWI